MKNEKITVHLSERSYDILIANDRCRKLGRLLKKQNLGRKALVVTNPPVYRKYHRDLEESLREANIKPVFFKNFETDERAKSQKSVNKLLRKLVAADRDPGGVFLICFAGGVLGDLTGFVAAIYKRGIPYVQVPTTLLAQVDSAIGGKTAVDLPEGKNLVGAFYQPRLVYSELSILKELPNENVRDGLSEAIKYGMIQSEVLFRFIERNVTPLLKKETKPLQTIVKSASRIKARIVEQDEYDKKGKRILLNFGHTLGHALEKASGYKVRHGPAISVGMLLAAEISQGLGLIRKSEVMRLERLLRRVGLPTTLSELDPRHRWHMGQILEAESRDKKFVRGKNRYVLPTRIGHGIVKEGIPQALIRKVILNRRS